MSAKRAFASNERQVQTERLHKLGRSMLLALATLLSLGTFLLFAVDQLYRPDTFVIDQLKIRGKFHYMQPARVEKAVGELAVGNFFSVDLDSIKQHVEGLDWVQRAEVRREWPNTLLIDVAEHRPVMRWGKSRWINSKGEVISLSDNVSLPDPVRLSGNERDAGMMLQTAVRWKKQLAHTGLDLRSVSLRDSHAWSIEVFDPARQQLFELVLGRQQVEQRLARFEYLFINEFQHSNLKLTRVDARYPDGLAIRASKFNSDDKLALNQPVTNLTR